MVDYTYIAVRYEDFFMVFVVLVFFVDIIRRKVTFRDNPFIIPIVCFWIVAFVSFFVGFYYYQTIKTVQLGFLNSARRVEYMVIFFIIFASLRNKAQFYLLLNVLMGVLGFVSLYGIGQKFLGFPAIQTMNPHYAKGYLLFLDATARISSTFGGHYDFAAYLTYLIPLVLGVYIANGKKRYFAIFFVALFALILTASRISYGAYLLTMFPFLLLIRKWKLFIVVALITVILTPLSQNLTQRISRTFREQRIWYDPVSGTSFVPRTIRPDDLPPGDFLIGKTKEQVAPLKGATAAAVIKGAPKKTGKMITLSKNELKNVKKEIRLRIEESAKKTGKIFNEAEINKMVDDTFATLQPAQSIVPDISFATRLQVEWPRAVAAFYKSPIIGLGPSSITEATDNNLLRTLGEFGLLGFFFFYGTIGIISWKLWMAYRKSKTSEKYIFMGLFVGTGALMVNATYIDVFEASKVAFIIWFVWGMFMKYLILPVPKIK